MIGWQEPPPRNGEERTARDAVRLYGEMWSADRVAELFGYDDDAMRRLLARHGALRGGVTSETVRAERLPEWAPRRKRTGEAPEKASGIGSHSANSRPWRPDPR